jgi:hypothetical protein
MLLRVITAMPVLKHMIERLENPFERFETTEGARLAAVLRAD